MDFLDVCCRLVGLRPVERAMAYAVEEYDDDLAVARLAWLAHGVSGVKC